MSWSDLAIDVGGGDVGNKERNSVDEIKKNQESLQAFVATMKLTLEEQGKSIEKSQKEQADLKVVLARLGQFMKLLIPKQNFPLPGEAQTRRMAGG